MDHRNRNRHTTMPIARHSMYETIFDNLPLPISGNILGISGMKYFKGSNNYQPSRKIIDESANISEISYPKEDLRNLSFSSDTFDFVICDQVIEHVDGNIQKGFSEMRRVLRPGGLAIITSALLYPIHWGPKDYWRFTPDGLQHYAKDFSRIIHVGGWGNRFVCAIMFLWPKFADTKVPHRKFSLINKLATINHEKYPIMTWIIAQK